jgi:hypothetical protein
VWANVLNNPTIPAQFYDKHLATSATRVFWPDPQNQALPDIAFDNYLSLKDYRVAIEQQAAYRASNLPNLNLLDRQPSLNNFEPLRPDSFERFTRLLNTTASPALMKAAGVGETSVRVWMVPAATAVNSLAEAETMISSAEWNPAKIAIIEGDQNFSSNQDAGTAQITNETPLEITINVESPGGGVMVLADTYYPGWQATVDDDTATIYRTNLNFRAVVIQPGQHIVRFIYRPMSFFAGAAISAISMLIYGLLALIGGVRMQQRSNPGGDHIDSDQVIAPFGNNHIGVTLARLNKFKVHRTHRREILVND